MAEIKAVEPDMTEDDMTEVIRENEGDLLEGLLAAAEDAEEETVKIDIVRNDRHYFSFSIHPLSEERLSEIRKKYTKYEKNRRTGLKVATDLDNAKYRSSVIYNSTIQADKDKIWDNKKIWEGLRKQGRIIVNALDVIDAVLLPGEKDKIMETADELNGYDNEDLKVQTAKN